MPIFTIRRGADKTPGGVLLGVRGSYQGVSATLRGDGVPATIVNDNLSRIAEAESSHDFTHGGNLYTIIRDDEEIVHIADAYDLLLQAVLKAGDDVTTLSAIANDMAETRGTRYMVAQAANAIANASHR